MDSEAITKNILLAEDDPSSQLLIEHYLSSAGHRVALANNGKEALQQLNSTEFDLCILDMQMPEMNGVDVLLNYKEHFPKSVLPFIVLTANSEDSDSQKCMDAGASLFLNKPIKSTALRNAIDSLFKVKNNQTNDDEQDIIDISYLKSFDDPEFLNGFIKKFDESVHKIINELKQSIDNDFDNFKKIIHSIKGLSGNINANHLRKVTIEVESISKVEYENNSQVYLVMIINELLRVEKELMRHIS